MSSIDLVILGFLKKRPMSAYDIAKLVEVTRMSKWMKVGSPTVYQNLKKLATGGFLSTETVRQGNMPEKSIYSLTPAGETHWRALMERFSKQPGKIYFDFNAFVINLGLVDEQDRLEMLEGLKDFFLRGTENLARDMIDLKDVAREGKAIMKQYRYVFDGMIRWVNELISEYGASNGGT